MIPSSFRGHRLPPTLFPRWYRPPIGPSAYRAGFVERRFAASAASLPDPRSRS